MECITTYIIYFLILLLVTMTWLPRSLGQMLDKG